MRHGGHEQPDTRSRQATRILETAQKIVNLHKAVTSKHADYVPEVNLNQQQRELRIDAFREAVEADRIQQTSHLQIIGGTALNRGNVSVDYMRSTDKRSSLTLLNYLGSDGTGRRLHGRGLYFSELGKFGYYKHQHMIFQAGVADRGVQNPDLELITMSFDPEIVNMIDTSLATMLHDEHRSAHYAPTISRMPLPEMTRPQLRLVVNNE